LGRTLIGGHGKRPSGQSVGQCLHVITPPLLYKTNNVNHGPHHARNIAPFPSCATSHNTGVLRITPKAPVGPPRNMVSSFIMVYLSRPKVNRVDCLVPKLTTGEEVVGLEFSLF